MKTIKKSTLLELRALTLKYEKTGNMGYLDARIVKAKQLSTQAYGRDSAWLSFVDFIDSLVGVYGLYPKCSCRELCSFFQLLGFKVVDDREEVVSSES